MKHSLILISLIGITSSLSAELLKIEAGGGFLHNLKNESIIIDNNIANDISNTENENNLDKNYYLYADIEHPIPVVPNARIEYYDNKNENTLNENMTFDGTTFNTGSTNNINYRSVSAIGYWSLPIPGPIDIDFGAGLNKVDGSVQFMDSVITKNKNFSEEIPFLYGNINVSIPTTDIALEGSLKYNKNFDKDKYNFMESILKVSYSINDLNLFAAKYKIKLESGVKITENTINDNGMNLNYKDTNVFAGLGIMFGSF